MLFRKHKIESITPSESTSTSWDHLGDTIPFSNSPDKIPKLPTSSPNQTCNFYLRAIERESRMNDIKSFLDSTLSHEPYTFHSESQLEQFCISYSDYLDSHLTSTDKTALKDYSGFNYKTINQVARGQWNYDLLGTQTPEKLAFAQESISTLSHAISSAPSLNSDIATYRGTNLDSFHGYNINSLSDLTNLKNQFFFESGFTSTSLSPNHSFINRDFDDPLRQSCNISIEYILPHNNHETVGLLSSETSYNPEQREVLINKDSLSYISDVKVSPDQSTAHLQMILIPYELYDPHRQP